MLGDIVPPEQGQGPLLSWSLWDSIWLSLESMPVIGPIVQGAEGPANTAQAKAGKIIVASSGIPPITLEDAKNGIRSLGNGLQEMADILVVGLVVAGMYYGYKIIKEVKS
jgi:hypothetical protein